MTAQYHRLRCYVAFPLTEALPGDVGTGLPMTLPFWPPQDQSRRRESRPFHRRKNGESVVWKRDGKAQFQAIFVGKAMAESAQNTSLQQAEKMAAFKIRTGRRRKKPSREMEGNDYVLWPNPQQAPLTKLAKNTREM